MTDYRERLWVPWWAWPAAESWPLALGIAYGYATNTAVGWAVGVGTGIAVAIALVQAAAEVSVTKQRLRAGRASIETKFLGKAQPLDRPASKRLRGVEADGRAYSLVRGWVSTAIRVEIDDPRDPTPYWYVSTRQPDALAAAINRATAGDVQGFQSVDTMTNAEPGEPDVRQSQ
ncbi:MAG TPA: DUF3093 domain-containing protein [Actinomycetes bacterium]|nr:DUF3093 domain-containing protein [Actinomycetes bacterium]